MGLPSEIHSPAGGVVTLHTPLHDSYARIIRQAIVDTCVHAGMSEFKTAQMEMAADEASSIIFEARAAGAQGAGDTGNLTLRLYQENKQVVVEIYHRGDPIEVGAAADPETWYGEEDPAASGLFVIQQSVDELSYTPGTPWGHCLRMAKTI